MTRQRLAAFGLVVAAVAVVVVILIRLAGSRRPDDVASVGVPEATAPVQPALAPEVQPSRVPVASVERRLRIVDAVDRRPLREATLALLQANGVPSMVGEVTTSVPADEDGSVPWRQCETEDTVVARCPGYVPRVFRLSASAAGDLELARAAELTVDVIDDVGRPVAGATVCILTSAATPFLDQDATLAPGIGHPLSEHPQWVGETDGAGRARFTEIPPGRLHMSVLSDFHVPSGASGAGEALELGPGPASVTVALAEVSAVVFGTDGAAKVCAVSWMFDRRQLDNSSHVVSRLARVRSALQRRFPDCQVLVHRLARPGDELIVSCHAQLEDDTLMRGVWALQPISTIEAPVQMERMPGVHHAVTVRLQDELGRDFPGIRLRLGSRETGFFMDTETGAKVVLPEGTYEASTSRLELFREFRELVVDVHAGGPREFVVRVPYAMCELVTEIELPGEESLGWLTIEVWNEHGQAPAVVNWRPSRGHPRHFLRGTSASVRISSPFYERFEVTDHPLSKDGPTTLRVRLALKEQPR